MTVTQNKGYAVQSTGDNAGTWGAILNDDMISIVDNNMGGIVSKSVAGSNITLSDTESQMVIVSLSGAQSADIQLTTSCIGFFFVENLTTNSFNITVVNDQIATGVVVPKGRSTVISDATNGCRIAGTDSFPPGTRMAFNQSAAPTGWTKDGTIDDAAIRLSSVGGSTGGSSGFTTVFQARTISKANLPNYGLTVTDPGHSHTATLPVADTDSGGGRFADGSGGGNATIITTTTKTTGITVNSGGSGTALDFSVKYYDFCVAAKN